jgi:hypothetical protein
MADTGIYATSLEIINAAGAKANAVSISEEGTNQFIAMAEGEINAVCRKVFAADQAAFAALPAGGKKILSSTAANLAAIRCIEYDMSGFTTSTEAEDMINILRDTAIRNMAILRDDKVQRFIINGA